MPDDLRAQIEPLLAILKAQGHPLLRIVGVEADDVIGTLARRAEAGGYQVIISTGDKDMSQLVNDAITIVNTMTGSRLDRDGVKPSLMSGPNRSSITWHWWVMRQTTFRGSQGGAEDRAKWLAKYQTADGIIEHARRSRARSGRICATDLRHSLCRASLRPCTRT